LDRGDKTESNYSVLSTKIAGLAEHINEKGLKKNWIALFFFFKKVQFEQV